MSIATYFKALWNKASAKGSVFVKIAEADDLALEAKGRIIAVDAANAAKTDLVAFYEKEKERVHADVEAIKDRFNKVLADL